MCVTLRLDIHIRDETTVVKLAGALRGCSTKELDRVCRDIMTTLVLDLTDLRAVDEKGVEALRRLGDRGAELSNASPLMLIYLEQKSRHPSNKP